MSAARHKLTISPTEIEEANRRIPLVVLVGGVVALKKGFGGHWGLCPLHDEKTPSFKVDHSGRYFICFGCDEKGDAIAFVRKTRGLAFPDAVKWLLGTDPIGRRSPAPPEATGPGADEADKKQRCEAALTIWHESRPAPDTLVEIYLRSRGITILPPSLRFHPNLKHGLDRFYAPAMVAAVQGPDGKITGIHRTYLLADGSGKAKVAKPKLAKGVVKHGSVRLAAAAAKIGIAEGIETGLSVQQVTGLPVWATVGTSGFGNVILPPEVREVIICADPGQAGEIAANNAAKRFMQKGRTARIAKPSGDGDFNDVLKRAST